MARDDRKRADQAATRKAAGRDARKPEKPPLEHRLRGAKFTEDFGDADRDSCTATRHRDGKVSES